MKLSERPVNTDLPRERAFFACSAALCFQADRRMLRFDLDVFFLGTAMTAPTLFLTTLQIYQMRAKAVKNIFNHQTFSSDAGAIAHPKRLACARSLCCRVL